MRRGSPRAAKLFTQAIAGHPTAGGDDLITDIGGFARR
jgi:hypothetical protein